MSEVLVLAIDNVEELSDREWHQLLNSIPESFHQNILKYKYWNDRQATLFGKLLLKYALRKLNKSNELFNSFKLDAYNRPFFEDETGIEFNISHTEGMVVCAVSNDVRIGIDVENIKEIDLQDFKVFFTDKEYQEIMCSGEINNIFYSLWTKKEAALKADGRGFSLDPKKCEILNDKVRIEAREWHIKQLSFSERYACHLVLPTEKPVRFEFLTLAHVTDFLNKP